ncbi:hypothetical protein CPJCM30710_24120 [Clostridium polyendosporum]|uniref:Uncharacterized protein n=1 Tax=Clostridium polyendosporum TaxID=69208 RepID=A0A919VHJ5_9CLOT|nr:DUF2161 family putative PD-(D/E)XK-type phosphodiesterase [Clostridium polyendosporum]GIM29746.1 hypothetical protein CPJCM30710_24120 [Clostridium polyendosporum]
MNNSNKKMLEEELWSPVNEFLIDQGYTVRSEVKYCDISAVKDNELIVVELKRSLSVDLLVQAVNRQKIADSVYIAVPKPQKMIGNSKWKNICHLIRRLELGLILVSFNDDKAFIEIPIHPETFDRKKSQQINKKKRTNIIKEINERNGDYNIGGSKGRKLVTAYRESSIFIACCLELFGPLSPKKLRELGTDPKKTTSILSKNFYGWFKNIEKGLYDLSEEGKKELKDYEKLAHYYYKRINNINTKESNGDTKSCD